MLKNVFKRSYFSNAYISITFLKSSTITVFIDKIKVKPKVLLRIKSSLVNWFWTLIRNDFWLQICCGIDTYEKNFGLTFHLTNKHLRDQDFMVFDFTKPVDDALSICLGWDIPLKLDE